MMATTKIRSNLYLDKELKEKAKEIFKEYGLSLSDGINMLLSRVVKNRELIIPKELDIEPIDENDPDYKIVEKTRGEETISLKEFMKLFPYPLQLDADTNGTIHYNFPSKTLTVKTRLDHTSFLHTKTVDTVYKKAGINMLKEHFDNAVLEAGYRDHIVTGNIIMDRGKSHFYLTNVNIDTKLNTINAHFDFNMQKQAFSGKIYGNLKHPKVKLDMQKLIRHEMDKQLDSIMGEGNRKLMQNMPMGGVAEDMASGMGGAFMGLFF